MWREASPPRKKKKRVKVLSSPLPFSVRLEDVVLDYYRLSLIFFIFFFAFLFHQLFFFFLLLFLNTKAWAFFTVTFHRAAECDAIMLWRQNRLSFMSPIMVFKKVPSTEVRSLFRKSSGVIQFLCVTLWEHIPRMGISGATVIIILTLHSHFFVLNHGWWGHGKLFNVRQAGYNHLSLHLSVQLTSFHCFCCFLGFFFSIFAVPSLVISSDAAVHSVHWLVDDMCPLNRGREKKRHDRDGKTRGFPPSLNGVYSIKTDAGSNFMVSTLREKKK